MASVIVMCSQFTRNITMEPLEIPALNIEKSVKAVQNYIKELEASEAKNQRY